MLPVLKGLHLPLYISGQEYYVLRPTGPAQPIVQYPTQPIVQYTPNMGRQFSSDQTDYGKIDGN